jgi:hypothetical protein
MTTQSQSYTELLTEKQIEDFVRACIKAQQLIDEKKDIDDGGTCNLDCVLIACKLNERSEHHFTNHAQTRIGYPLSGFWKGYRFLNFTLYGQANRRTVGAEIAYQHLKNLGYTVACYYHMD